MMYRTFYDKATGRIIRCSKMSDAMLAKNLANNPGWASIDAEVKQPGLHKVNLDTLQIEPIVFDVDIPAYIRKVRKMLLESCDWTQTVDCPLSAEKKAAWAAYRQALRDLPDTTTATTVEEIVWPQRP